MKRWSEVNIALLIGMAVGLVTATAIVFTLALVHTYGSKVFEFARNLLLVC